MCNDLTIKKISYKMEKSVIWSIMTDKAGDDVSHHQINSTHLLHWLKTWTDKERKEYNRIVYNISLISWWGVERIFILLSSYTIHFSSDFNCKYL